MVKVELPDALWQRCVVHFERNVLASVPQHETKMVVSDLKVIFQTARSDGGALPVGFAERYQAATRRRWRRLSGG